MERNQFEILSSLKQPPDAWNTHTHTLKASIDLFYAALVHFPYDPSTSSKMLPCVRRAVLPLHSAHRSLFASSITLGEKKMKKVGCVCVCVCLYGEGRLKAKRIDVSWLTMQLFQ